MNIVFIFIQLPILEEIFASLDTKSRVAFYLINKVLCLYIKINKHLLNLVYPKSYNYILNTNDLILLEYYCKTTKYIKYPYIFLLKQAAIKGNIEIFNILKKYGKFDKFEGTMIINGAVANGHLDVVQWLHNNGTIIHISTIDVAARNGYFNIVKYLHYNGSQITNITVKYAALSGNLDLIKWLYEKCGNITYSLFNSDTANNAASAGHLHIVQWLHAHNSTPDYHGIYIAVCNKHDDLAIYIFSQLKVGIPKNIFDLMKLSHIFQFIQENSTLLNDNYYYWSSNN